jgi:LPS sulfotransferase NodH
MLKRFCSTALNLVVGPWETMCLPRDDKVTFPPIFIVGCPRSGTTLCIQILVARFRLSYPTNVFRYLPMAPWLGTKVLGPRLRLSTVTYDSRFGRVNGLGAPSEAGEFLYRWFPRWPTFCEATPELVSRLKGLRRYVAAFSREAKASFIMKNTYNSLRIGPLARAMPEALFLWVQRDVSRTALSLLRARKTVHGSVDTWFSLVPKDYDEIRQRTPHEQVLLQAISIASQIEKDLAEYVPADRVFTIAYEEMCSDPRVFASEFARFVSNHGTTLDVRGEIPERFGGREDCPDAEKDEEVIESTLRSLSPELLRGASIGEHCTRTVEARE